MDGKMSAHETRRSQRRDDALVPPALRPQEEAQGSRLRALYGHGECDRRGDGLPGPCHPVNPFNLLLRAINRLCPEDACPKHQMEHSSTKRLTTCFGKPSVVHIHK